jgi:MFS family permease
LTATPSTSSPRWRANSPARLIALLFATSVLGMLGFSSFAALLPQFQSLWGLSNTEAGWISGIYFAGYVLAVPLLVGGTDRADPRKIYLLALVIGGAASCGYALFAQGFWSALWFRALAGIGLAGTYMPGLKLLTDHAHSPRQSRYVALYTAGFGVAVGISYAFAGEVADWLGWRAAFWGPGLGAAVCVLLILFLAPATSPELREPTQGHPLDFRPVFKNRAAMAFVFGYAGHTFELFAMRAWLVAFLIRADLMRGGSGDISGASWLTTLVVLLSTGASFYGAEIAARADRRLVIGRVMIASVLVAVATGFSLGLPVWLVAALCSLYGMVIMADSAALTGGAVLSAAKGRRGATLAVHTVMGFGAGFCGPLAVGVVLDLAGGEASRWAWGFAFLTMGAGSLTALAAIRKL